MVITETKYGQNIGEPIPYWIRNNAGWWAQGSITDEDFVSGIEFLIQKGIMRLW